jgi:hypothetical protein
MCYSFNTSILSYALGMGSSIYALNTNQIILGVLILFYCQMQLSEALIWRGIDTDSWDLNKIGTKYGKYLLPTHPFAIGLGILIVALQKKRIQDLDEKDLLPIIIGIVFYMYVVNTYYIDEKYQSTSMPINKECRDCQNFGNRLVWGYEDRWYMIGFVFSLIFFVFYIEPFESKIFIGSVFTATYLLSKSLFPTVKASSFWCFSSAIIAPFIVWYNGKILNNAI